MVPGDKQEPHTLDPLFARGLRYMMWTDKGWWPILLDLDKAIAHIDPDYMIMQVKEKYGGLRFYTSHNANVSDEDMETIDKLVDIAEEKCWKTCEICGKPGQLRRPNGWMKTLCDKHHKQRERGGNIWTDEG